MTESRAPSTAPEEQVHHQMPSARRAIAAAVLTAVVAGPALAAHLSVGAADCDGTITYRPDGWTEIVPAVFPEASDKVTAMATSPQLRNLMYVTNGSSVQRSADAGCTWQLIFTSETFHVGQLTLGPEPPRVASIHVPPRDPRRLYIVLEETTALETSRASVLTSADSGTTYETVTRGLPATGIPVAFAPGLRRGIAYFAVSADTGVDLYATGDSGVEWTRRGTLGDVEVTALAVDPRAERRLWAIADSRLVRSDDGGATFRPVAKVPEHVGALSVSMTAASTRIAVAHRASTRLSISYDDGASWRRVKTPSVATSIAAPSGRLAAMAYAGNNGVYLAGSERAPWKDVSPTGEQPRDVGLSDLHAGGYDLLGRTSRGILRMPLTAALTRAPRPGTLPPIDLGRVPSVSTGTVQLNVGPGRVSLKPGEVRDLDVLLDLPPVPTPLDVVFLVDTTGSMSPTIAGLRDGIGEVVRDLARAGIDAKFGLGDFRDYPISPYGSEGDHPYRLLRKVGPPDDAYREAIGMLEAGGGGDGPESSLTAMYQAATGAGDKLDGETVVEPGRDAGFRRDSLRVVLVATDAPFHDEEEYPGPTFEATAKALKERRVLQMGLSVGGGALGGGRTDLEEMATATGTLAPSGVDCNGDRRVDVPAGRPLVCDVDPLPVRLGVPGTQMNLAPAIIGLLRSVRDLAPVSLRTSGESRMTSLLAPTTYDAIDVKVPNRLRYRVRLSCTSEFYGTTADTTLQALRRTTVLATEVLRVACASPVGAVAVPRVPLPPAPAPPVPPLAVAALPPPPPPGQQPPPQTNPQAQPQPNPNPQMQAGGAYEEQQEHELALAHVDVEEETELAMSALTRPAPDLRPLWASALALTLAAGVSTQRHSARQEARAWTRG
jgi:hypothetical protein